MTNNNHLFCFGYGYSCDYLGHALMERGGWRVSGTTRSSERRETLRARGVQAHIFDSDHPLLDPLYILRDATHIVISTPPDDEGDPAFNIHGLDLTQCPNLKWVGYLSTNAVYGDRGGGQVDETSEIRPSSKRGSRRAKAESQWLSLLDHKNLPVHIFRLAGIYGPGRSALDSIRAGVARRINKPGHAFGRIHVEDIANVLMASMQHPAPGQIYNICDDMPAPSHEVIEYACKLLHRPPPPMVDFEDANLAPITRSFYMDNRRVQNRKIKSDLGVVLKYPDFKTGLDACLAAEEYAITIFKQQSAEGFTG
jgi:nucleoside-diphosphate-sugar epimerase